MNLKIKKLLVCFSFLFLLQVIPGVSMENQLLKSNFSEKKYNEVEDAFIKSNESSSHIELLLSIFKEAILPHLKSKKSFLDIGAGPGEITNRIASYFTSSTIVEPNPLYKEKYTSQKYTVYTANFQDIQLPQKYDFVLCSNVLYYVEHNKWATFLERLHSCINKGGQGLVILAAPCGKYHEFSKSINPNYSNSALIERDLGKLNIKYRKITKHVSFTADYKEFKQIFYLFTIDNCFPQQAFAKLTESEKKSIFAKFDAFIEGCRTDDGRYKIIWDEDFFVFQPDLIT